MGILRLFLAFAVVVAHTGGIRGFEIIDGEQAVRVFFVISGFYMSLILSEKYPGLDRPTLRLFYGNRALRIFPMLWLVLAIELTVAAAMHHLGMLSKDHWLNIASRLFQQGRLPLLATYALTQASSLGVDVMHLFSLSPSGTLHFYTGPVTGDGYRGWKLYPMSHAWSISCELVFYMCAPFMNRLRSGWVALCAILPAALAYAAPFLIGRPLASVASGFLAPFQMGFFALGILAYRLYAQPRIYQGTTPLPTRMAPIAALLIVLLTQKALTPVSYTVSQVCLYSSLALGIPFLFQLTRSCHWDRLLGDLSYPLYLCHISVIRVLDQMYFHDSLGKSTTSGMWRTAATIVASVVLSWLLVVACDRHIERWRQRRVLARKPGFGSVAPSTWERECPPQP